MRTRETDYFATLNGLELVAALENKINLYYDDLQAIGLAGVIERSYRAYYGANLAHPSRGSLFDSVNIGKGGKKGEIRFFKANHYRNITLHTLQLTTSNRPAYQAKANNADANSLNDCGFATGLVDYYMSEQGMEKLQARWAEYALVQGEGNIVPSWNQSLGDTYSVGLDGQPATNGDIEVDVVGPLSLIRETTLKDDIKLPWVIVRRWKNKWDYAARFPELKDHILAAAATKTRQFDFEAAAEMSRNAEGDMVPVWLFLHEKCPALPEGRVVEFVPGAIIIDAAMEYKELPVYQLHPANIQHTPYGYSPVWDLLGVQQGIDILGSAIMSNNAANAVQNLWTKPGSTIDESDLEGGLRHIESEEEPKALQLTKTAAETYKFRSELIAEMETLGGISATVRGNPEASLKSGAALALVVSQSVQFASLFENPFVTQSARFATGIIRILQQFATVERMAEIAGEGEQANIETFTGERLRSIHRITCEQVSPLSKTVAGRVQLADSLLEKGMIKSPDEYVSVLLTGRIEGITSGKQKQFNHVRAENERLRKGQRVRVLVADNHPQHIQEHKALVFSPELRDSDNAVLQAVLEHIQEHLQQWAGMDAFTCAAYDIPAPPIAPQAPMGPGVQAPAPQQGAEGGDIAEMTEPQENVPGQPRMPNLPPVLDDGGRAQAAYEQVPAPNMEGIQ